MVGSKANPWDFQGRVEMDKAAPLTYSNYLKDREEKTDDDITTQNSEIKVNPSRNIANENRVKARD